MDARRRARERGAEADDPHAEAQLLVERVRAGELPREQVLLLAYAGHPGLAAQLVEDVAEWAAFRGLDDVIDLLLGGALSEGSLATWLVGLACFDPAHLLRVVGTVMPQVMTWAQALEVEPNLDFFNVRERERERGLVLLQAGLDALVNWETDHDASALRARYAQLARHEGYGLVFSQDIGSLFDLPAHYCTWAPRFLENSDSIRLGRHHVEEWLQVLQEFGLTLEGVYRDSRAALQAHTLSGVGPRAHSED